MIPNGFDGAEHATYRAIVDRYLTPDRVAQLEPRASALVADLVKTLPRDATMESVAEVGVPFAVRIQSAWLGWSPLMEPQLVAWMRENHAATRSGDRRRTTAVAEKFDEMIRSLLDVRRGEPATDVTGELMRETVHGRPLTQREIVSILRNWTAGDLGSLAASVGVIGHFLTTRPGSQQQLRDLTSAHDAAAVEAAIEEILRIDDPFVSNRRRATRDTELAGRRIEKDARVLTTGRRQTAIPRSSPNRTDSTRPATPTPTWSSASALTSARDAP